MTKQSFRAILLAAGALAATGPALAQSAAPATPPRWKPSIDSVTVTAMPWKEMRAVLTGTHISEAFAVSASIPVPYSDLNLVTDPGADELNRRIGVAARLVCTELDIKYPPHLYPNLGDTDCEDAARKDGLEKAGEVIASKRR
jgi:UrcA family protein